MILIYRNLYISDKVKDAGDIVARLRRGEPVSGVRLVTMPGKRTAGEQFSHMSAGMLKQQLLRRQDYYLIGLASGTHDALTGVFNRRGIDLDRITRRQGLSAAGGRR